VQYLSIGSDVKGPAEGDLATFGHNAVGLCHAATWIAEDRVVELEFFGKVSIYLCFIATGGEISDVEFL